MFSEPRKSMKFDQIGENNGKIKCPFPNCNTNVIPLTDGLRGSITTVPNAPKMVNLEKAEKFFKINDMWDFDNIGVSRDLPEIDNFTVDDVLFDIERILICSECDKGPIGFAGHFKDQEKLPNNLTFFLSCDSMEYQI